MEADISLYYDWLEEEGYRSSLIGDLTEEEILNFIKYIIKRYKGEVENGV